LDQTTLVAKIFELGKIGIRTAMIPISIVFTRNPILYRSMSTTSKPRFEWLVMLPDKPNALAKRLEIRPTHLENIEPDVQRGSVVLGGAYLSEQPVEGQTPDMLGSAMIFVADSKEEVLERIKHDIYATSGVWDVDKVNIWPFRSAIRKEKE